MPVLCTVSAGCGFGAQQKPKSVANSPHSGSSRRMLNKSWSFGALPPVSERKGVRSTAAGESSGAERDQTEDADHQDDDDDDDGDENVAFATLHPAWSDMCRMLLPFRLRHGVAQHFHATTLLRALIELVVDQAAWLQRQRRLQEMALKVYQCSCIETCVN